MNRKRNRQNSFRFDEFFTTGYSRLVLLIKSHSIEILLRMMIGNLEVNGRIRMNWMGRIEANGLDGPQ